MNISAGLLCLGTLEKFQRSMYFPLKKGCKIEFYSREHQGEKSYWLYTRQFTASKKKASKGRSYLIFSFHFLAWKSLH